MISILVVDDHVAVGLGTKALIEKYDEMNVDVVHDSMEVEKKLRIKNMMFT